MTIQKEYYQKQANSIMKHLSKRGMEGCYCENREAAVKKALSLMPENASVSWGGSETLKETGMIEALQASSRTLIDRDQAASKDERDALLRQAFSVDYYFMSSNAITIDGQLVNIDGSGNRVAALCFGPANIIIMAGMNKIVTTVEEAIDRVHNFAAPPNSMRLNLNTPCSKNGVCSNCLSPDCICAQTVVTRFCRIPGRIKVILIGENLGY